MNNPDDSWILSPVKLSSINLIDKSLVKDCTHCSKSFNNIIKKHNCRCCGKVYCATCSKVYRCLTEDKGGRIEKIRYCYDCTENDRIPCRIVSRDQKVKKKMKAINDSSNDPSESEPLLLDKESIVYLSPNKSSEASKDNISQSSSLVLNNENELDSTVLGKKRKAVNDGQKIGEQNLKVFKKGIRSKVTNHPLSDISNKNINRKLATSTMINCKDNQQIKRVKETAAAIYSHRTPIIEQVGNTPTKKEDDSEEESPPRNMNYMCFVSPSLYQMIKNRFTPTIENSKVVVRKEAKLNSLVESSKQ